MSLESQVAALVSAASKLTSEIAGKMKGIDQKVDQATQAVPSTIRAYSQRTFFVDAVEGSDTEGDGGSSSPFQTVGPLTNQFVAGGFFRVLMREGQTHLSKNGEGVQIPSGTVRFERWGNTNGVDRPEIVWEPVKRGDENRGNYLSSRHGLFIFVGIDVKARNLSNGLGMNYLDGFVRNYQSTVSVIFNEGSITLEDAPFFPRGNNMGRSEVALFLDGTSVDVISNSNGRSMLIEGIAASPSVYTLAASLVSMPSHLSWSDLVFYNPDVPHAKTNLSPSSLIK